MTTPSSVEGWCTPGKVAFLFGLLILAMFPDVVVGQATFYYRDFGIYSYPLAHYQRECFWAGELPFWNPLNNCGLPFLAQWNTMSLYPPALFYLLLPLAWALGAFCLLHLFLGGLGMYWLVRAWTRNPLAAVVAGVVYMFNGFSWHALMWTGITAALGWMPWLVLSVSRAWRQGGRWILISAAVGTLQMLTGAVELIFFTWMILGVLFLGELGRGQESPFVRRLGRFVLVVILVAGLAALQLLPFLELLRHSQRGSGTVDAEWSMPAWGLANLLVPLLHCYRSFQGVFVQPGQFWVTSYYTGIATLLLAAWGVWKVREPRVWALTVLAAMSLVLALGEHSLIYRELSWMIPALGYMRFPVKFVMAFVFVLPVLAGYGLAHLRSCPASAGKGFLVLLFLLLAGVGATLWQAHVHPLRGDDWPATWWCGLIRACCLAVASVSVWMLSGQRQGRTAFLGAAVLVATLWLDVRTHTPNLQPTVPLSVYAPGLATRELKLSTVPRLGESRLMMSAQALDTMRHRSVGSPAQDYVGRRLALFANCNLLDDLPKVNGFFPLGLAHTAQVLGRLDELSDATESPLANFLGVAQVTAANSPIDWRPRAGALPMVTAGQLPVLVEDAVALSNLTSHSFAPRQVTYLSPEEEAWSKGIEPGGAEVISAEFNRHRIAIRIRAQHQALLSIAQSAYPGWKARLDGQPARLVRANVAFQALAVPAGEHRIELFYRDDAFRRGAMISATTLVLLCGAGLGRRRRGRR